MYLKSHYFCYVHILTVEVGAAMAVKVDVAIVDVVASVAVGVTALAVTTGGDER